MSRSSNGRALITGASGGIGAELARVFASEGFDLVLVARNQQKLEALELELRVAWGTESRILARDLTQADAPSDIFSILQSEKLPVDVLVNNAGVGNYAPFAETSTARHLEIVRLNVAALTELTSLFLPPMVARGYGRVLNVASIAGFQPTPFIALYGATKAFIISLTEALSVELEGTGVTATVLCPGFTGSEMIENLSEQAGDSGLIPEGLLLDAATVAREGFDACIAGTPVHVNGPGYRLGLLWESWQPRWLVRTMGAAMSRAMRPTPRRG